MSDSTGDVLDDLRACFAVAKTQYCKDLLQAEISAMSARLERMAAKVMEAQTSDVGSEQQLGVTSQGQVPHPSHEQEGVTDTSSEAPPVASIAVPEGTRDQSIKQYAWDQSEKFVNLYITLTGDRDRIETEFPDDRTALLRVFDFKGGGS